jgi:peptide/nickel transport system substrate-binding protein
MGKEFHIKGSEKLLATIKSFSATEKFIFGIFVIIVIVSALSLAFKVNNLFLEPVPAKGGSLSEGIVGLPRYINPVLSFTDIDRDLSALVYAGLMKYDNGKIIPDLAEKYEVSADGLTYTFTLRKDLRFHDGIPLTADDVEFTIQKIKDSVIKSPRRADWANISVKKLEDGRIQFVLKQPYAPFLANTTLGIIPKHIWSKVDADQFIYSQYNVNPVGAGPYKLTAIKHDSGGIPEYYSFTPFSRYHGGEAYISNLYVYFYPNEKSAVEAYSSGTIEALAGISPAEAATIASSSPSQSVLHTPLPRVFGIFFNQSQAPVLSQIEVRQALNMVVDKNAIVEEVLGGYGVRSDSPLPAGKARAGAVKSPDIEDARALLSKTGWALNGNGVLEKKDKKGVILQTLEFSISTVDAPDLKKAAELVKSQWELLGARVSIKVFEYGDLYQNIIATRKYDALLFGEFIGKDLDLYAFWHSSQRNAPGLNVAAYVNSKVDKLLDEARSTSDEKVRVAKYAEFEKIIQDEVPAVFLYSPDFIYTVPEKLRGMELGRISSPSDRFAEVSTWYTTTSNVWKVFNPKN